VHYLHEKRAESDSYADCKLNKFEGEDFIPTNPLAMLDANRLLRLWDEMAKEIDCESPQACAKAKEWDGMTVAEWLRANVWTDVTKNLGRLAVQSVLCKEPSEVSLLYWLTYVRSGQGIVRLIAVDNGGQERKFVQGAATIVERMAEKFVKVQKGALLLGRQVLSIVHREEFVEVSTACTGPQVRFSNAVAETVGAGSDPLTPSATLKAKQVILALAPSLYGKIRFEPPLPSKKRRLSDSVSMGSIIKTNIFYDRPFWRDYGFSGSIASMSGPVSYSLDDCGLNGEKCYSIMGFVLADHANHWACKTKHERMMAIAKQYSEMLGIEEMLRPVAYIEKDWSSEEFSGGCYVASMPCNVLTVYGDSLREAHAATGTEHRLHAPRVHFAGTELATKWIGYMDGAIEAGERAACDALKCLGVDASFEAEEAVDSVVKARPNDGEIVWWLPGVGQALMACAVGLLAGVALRAACRRPLA
jgi:monoamine oxidase